MLREDIKSFTIYKVDHKLSGSEVDKIGTYLIFEDALANLPVSEEPYIQYMIEVA